MVQRILKILLIILLALLIIAGFAIYRISDFLESQEVKVINNIGFLPNSTLTFESTAFSFFEDFPNATVILNNVQITDSLLAVHEKPFFKVGIVKGIISLKNLWEEEIEIKELRLRKGKIHWWTDINEYSNFSLSPNKKPSSDTEDSFLKRLKLKTEELSISLKDIEIQIQEAGKSSNLNTQIGELDATIQSTDGRFSAKIAADLFVHQLTFKEKTGTFLRNSQVNGDFSLVIKDSLLTIAPFDLQIDEENFKANAQIDWTIDGQSTIVFENKASRLEKIRPWLPPHIQKGISPYKIEKPFYSKTTIQTNFNPKFNPVVTVDFDLMEQVVWVDDFSFENTNLKGRFLNRIYDDERQKQEGRKRFKVSLRDVNATYQGFNIQSPSILVTKTKYKNPQLSAQTKFTGATSAISDWFENEDFLFQGGQFELLAAVEGDIKHLDSILMKTDATMQLDDFAVIYNPANVSFPFAEMTLKKEVGDAYFSIVNSSFVKNHDFLINGGLKNLPALMIQLANQKVTSYATVNSKKVSWTDFLNFFEKNGLNLNGKSKSERQKKQSMKTTVQGIYTNFQPRFSIKIDTLAYYDLLRLVKFRTGLHFENEHTLILEKTTFEYDGGQVEFSGKLDIRNPNQTPFEFELHTSKLNLKSSLPPLNYLNISMLANLEALPEALDLTICHKGILDDEKGLIPNSSTGEVIFKINEGKDLMGEISYEPLTKIGKGKELKTAFGKTKIKLEGNPKVFNNFFKTEQFFFNDGRFKVAFEYEGNPGNIKELLTSGDAVFTMTDSEVYYQPAGVSFPLTEIDLSLKDNAAIFEFDLNAENLPEKIHLIGNLGNISELLLGNTGKAITTEVEISSKKVDWESLFTMLSNKESTGKEGKSASAKTTVRGILNTFHPHLHVNIDSFIFSDKLAFSNLIGGVYLQDTSSVILEETDFNFNDGRISVNGEFEVGQPLMTPFSANIKAAQLGLKPLLESLDYLALPSLKNIDKLGGNITMNFDLAGVIDDKGSGLISNATQGNLVFDLRDVLVIGFDPIDAIAARMRMKKRFEELRFAPIIGELSIRGQEIEFPLLEIQSNALHLFLEGTLSYGDLTNMWVTLPLGNIRRTNRWVIPEKTSYAQAKRKVYIEVTSDKNGNNRFKFRLSKRKFYKHRGILDQFRKDKKRYRAIRKALKKRQAIQNTEVISSRQ